MNVGRYSSLQIVLPRTQRENYVSGGDARKITAKAIEDSGVDVPREFFHRDSETGNTLPGAPHIAFRPRKGGIDCVGLGEAGADLVDQFGNVLTRALTAHYGEPLEERWRKGPMSWRYMPYGMSYRVRTLVIQRKGRQRGLLERARAGDLTDVEITERISRCLVDGINSLSERLEIDAPELLLEDIAWREFRPIPYVAGYARAVMNLTFKANVDLIGPWLAGSFRSHGYGVILPA